MSDNKININSSDYAGFGVRFLALIIDAVFFVPYYYAIKYIAGNSYQIFAEAFYVISGTIIYALCFASKFQGTLGMYIMNFHICDTEGKKISFLRAIIWQVVCYLGVAICFGGIIYLQTRFDIFSVQDMMNSCKQWNVSISDCNKEIEGVIGIPFESFVQLCIASLALAAFLSFIWILSIALPKDKTGFHNLICHTRFVNGRV